MRVGFFFFFFFSVGEVCLVIELFYICVSAGTRNIPVALLAEIPQRHRAAGSTTETFKDFIRLFRQQIKLFVSWHGTAHKPGSYIHVWPEITYIEAVLISVHFSGHKNSCLLRCLDEGRPEEGAASVDSVVKLKRSQQGPKLHIVTILEDGSSA